GCPYRAGLGGISPDGIASSSTAYFRNWQCETTCITTAELPTEKAKSNNYDEIGSLIRLQETVKHTADTPLQQRRLVVLQQWEGVVTGINEDAISAQMHDLTD